MAANVQASHRLDLECNCQRRQRHPAALSDWDFDLDIAARLGPVQGTNNPINVMAQYRPLGVSEDDDRDFPARQVLLVPHVFVGRHKYCEGRGLGCVK
jgi:hypothetical protein